MAFVLMRAFKRFKNNEGCFFSFRTTLYANFQIAQKRKILAAAAAAGVSVAFGSPLGGVLFALEGIINKMSVYIACSQPRPELDTFANESEIMWRGFVASAIAAVALQYVDPFGTSKLVLFQVTSVDDTWRAFELVCR
jgi:chloride channel 3/4/5